MGIKQIGGGGGGGKSRGAKNSDSIDYGCLGKCIILPDKPLKVAWDLIGIVLLIYAIVTTPLNLGFGITSYCPQAAWVFDLSVDLFFCTDLLLNFITAAWVKDNEGELRLSGKLDVIAKEYLRSWFIIDIVSSVPLDAAFSLAFDGCDYGKQEAVHNDLNTTTVCDKGICSEVSAEGAAVETHTLAGSLMRMVRLIRMVKLFKILRVLKLGQRFNELADVFPNVANLKVVRVLNILVMIIYISHLLTCFWHWIGSAIYFDAGEARSAISWLGEAVIPMHEAAGLTWNEIGEAYIAAMYWTITTITTVGYGDITPTDRYERMFAMAVMVWGTGIFAWVIGSATVILTEVKDSPEAKLAEKMATLQVFMTEKELPTKLQIKLRRHFRHFWKNAGISSAFDQEILGLMSESLRTDTLRSIYKDMIRTMPIFEKHPITDFHNALLAAFNPLSLNQGDVLIKQGSFGTDVYILTKGELEVLYEPPHLKGAPKQIKNIAAPIETVVPKKMSVGVLSGGLSSGGAKLLSGAKSLKSNLSHLPKGLPTMKTMSLGFHGAPGTAPEALEPPEPVEKDDSLPVATLEAGALVGEVLPLRSLIFGRQDDDDTPHPRTATVVCKDEAGCELFSLDGPKFAEIVSNFQSVREDIVSTAKERLKKLLIIEKAAKRLHKTSLIAVTFTAKLRKNVAHRKWVAKTAGKVAKDDKDFILDANGGAVAVSDVYIGPEVASGPIDVQAVAQAIANALDGKLSEVKMEVGATKKALDEMRKEMDAKLKAMEARICEKLEK